MAYGVGPDVLVPTSNGGLHSHARTVMAPDTGPGHTSRGATMRVNRAFVAPAAVAMTAVMLSAGVAPAVAKDGDVRRSGSCSPSGHWKVKASPEDGRIEVEGE